MRRLRRSPDTALLPQSPQHNFPKLDGIQERDYTLVLFPRSIWGCVSGIAQRHRFRLHLEIDFRVDVGGIEADMPEPCADGVEIDTGLQQMTGACMTHDVR